MPADPRRARDLFLHAVGKLPPERWSAYVAAACVGDTELRRQVEHFLQVHREAGSFLERPPGGLGATGAFLPLAAEEAAALAEGAGTVIGPYKLIEVIGEGGMGTVWMAQQAAPVKRLVALKVIKPGMDSRQVLARFEAERQALALMDHPSIAKVLDAGATPAGRPYFVMELVKGVPITKYCDEQRLTPRERLALFIPVCQAIQHAHQKGIIHRDVKPSNVLVALYDAKPVPKVIDFGVAKAAGQQLTERTLVTGFGAVVGTLEYMSPEQAELNQLDIDTRSDIYSLGVLLYELLTGTTPLDRRRLREAPFAEVLRQIREAEPPRPSTRLAESKDTLPAISARRQTEPAKLTRLVRGELDWVVMKALEKDRNRRYESANALATDVQRYLADEPVQAGPPGVAYRLRKFLRRNRGPVLALGLIFLLLVAGIVGTTLGLVRALAAEGLAKDRLADVDRARAQAQTALGESEVARQQAEEVSQFLVEAFRKPDPRQDGEQVRVVEVLDRAVKSLEDEFSGQPRVKAELLDTLGRTYLSLGLPARAIEIHKKARAVRLAALGPHHMDTLVSTGELATSLRVAGQAAEAVALCEEALRLMKDTLGPDHRETMVMRNNLAVNYQAAGRPGDALPLYEESLQLHRAKYGPDHHDTILCLGNLARGYEAAGRLGEALPLYEETLRLMKANANIGPGHPHTLTSMNNLGLAYWKAGRRAEALPLLEETLKLKEGKLTRHHPDTLTTLNNLAIAYRDSGRLEEAATMLEEVVAGLKARFDPEHPHVRAAKNALAETYRRLGDHAGLERLLREALTIREQKEPEGWATHQTKSLLGDALLGQKRYAEAEPLLLQGYEGMKQRQDKIPADARARLAEALERLVKLYEATGKEKEAARRRKELETLNAPSGTAPGAVTPAPPR
jgi:serine/threonine protein kinase/tetratricopeptide (TPR) repeat protein